MDEVTQAKVTERENELGGEHRCAHLPSCRHFAHAIKHYGSSSSNSGHEHDPVCQGLLHADAKVTHSHVAGLN